MKHCRTTATIERLISWVFFACSSVSIVTTIVVIGVLFVQSVYFFKVVSFSAFFLDTQWTPLFTNKHFGIWPLVSGTLLTSGIAMAVALPFGLLAAVYLSEFAKEKTRRILKPCLEILAGIPTVVYGYFALVFLTPLLKHVLPNLSGFNGLSPGIVMGIMIIPMVSSLSEDALSAVPKQLKEAAYGLGARQLSVIFRVVIPTAFSGIASAITLAVGRAVGETMIVTIASGQRPVLTFDPQVPIETMTAYIVQVSMGDTPSGSLEYQTIFVVGAMLFAVTFMINLFSFRLSHRFRGAYG